MMEYNCTAPAADERTPLTGMNPVEAAAFLNRELPEVKLWTFLHFLRINSMWPLSRICGIGGQESGQIGPWRWERVSTSYPAMAWGGDLNPKNAYSAWVGAIRLHGPTGESFIMFSYLNNRDSFCKQYLASTNDLALLRRFVRDVGRHFRSRKRNTYEISVFNGPNIELPRTPLATESLFLPDGMLDDIDQQVAAFFRGREMFKKIGARFQRGFLFVGPPGTGKTMTMRRIVRTAYRDYKATAIAVNITRRLEDDDLAGAFAMAATRAPSVLLLDDVDSITKESCVSRASFLSMLDGLKANKGVLIIGSSNNPGHIDPALMHRPSRFDRVWTFPVPDKVLRQRYLVYRFPAMQSDILEDIAGRTGNWSYAYLNELCISAAILANGSGTEEITPDILLKATAMLGRQFESGRKNHEVAPVEGGVGFSRV